MGFNYILIFQIIWTTFVAFGCCWHFWDILSEYLSYPVVIDVILEDPNRQQIPHFSLCFELKEYLDANKTIVNWYKLQKQKDYFKMDNQGKEKVTMNCFKEYVTVQAICYQKHWHQDANGKRVNWTYSDYYRLLQQLY